MQEKNKSIEIDKKSIAFDATPNLLFAFQARPVRGHPRGGAGDGDGAGVQFNRHLECLGLSWGAS